MKKYWFKALTLLVFLALVVIDFIYFDSRSHSASDTLINVVPNTIVLAIILMVVWRMMGEKRWWRRGEKE